MLYVVVSVKVALFARAWIEIFIAVSQPYKGEVALFARAWIEISTL